MYHSIVCDNPMLQNSFFRLHLKELDQQKLARRVQLTVAETKNWLRGAKVASMFQQLSSCYLINEPPAMPRLLELRRRFLDQKKAGKKNKYLNACSDTTSWEGTDYCLRFMLRLMKDSEDRKHRDCDICRKPYDLGIKGAYMVMLFLCKWHMMKVAEENWLADGLKDSPSSNLAAWCTLTL